ncbi:hypothetical protein ACFRJ8_00505 [Arthrobacter sp. NPDC056886]|uniref:hypothetical protein n=1 Tax=Arthrobacter sp. NPDC056886 TaxID=3345960 RepID=UPI00366FC932
MAEVTPAGSGGTPGVSAPPADGSLRIRGGIGGVSFQFEELLAGAAALDGLVRQLQSVEVEADAVRRALFPYQSDSYTSGSNAIIAVGEAGRNVGRVRSQLQRIGDDVRASHREYEYAEARNALLLRMGFHGSEFGAAPAPFALPAVRGIVEDWTAMAPRNLAVLLGLPGPLAAVAGALSGPTDVRRLVRDASDAPGLTFLKPRPVSIVGRETYSADVDLSPAGLLRRAGAVGEQGGRIEVIEVDGATRPAWVVIIPGTQQGGLPEGTNPFDPAGIAEALGHDSAWTSAAIRQALEQAGAEAGDRLVAVGYSQGGIHAMNLSKDRAVLAEYDLKFVLTAGSPVGGISPGPGIRSLHLEHEQDWVPGADGLANPDTRDRVTVTLTNPLAMPPLQDFGLGPGHRLENYADGAALVSASRDNTLQDSTAALAAVVGTGGAATVSRFSLRREARPASPGTRAPRGTSAAPGPVGPGPPHGPGASSGRGREGSWPRGTPR